MDGNQIGDPIEPGWGDIFQSTSVDKGLLTLIASGAPPSRQWPPVLDKMLASEPVKVAPTVVVAMNRGEVDESFIDHDHVSAVFSVWIEDRPDATLPDHELIAWVDTVILWLSHGYNVLIHCAAGVSRSSYLDAAVQMRARKMTFDQALAFIRKYRPQANPNTGFTAHLQQIESELMNDA